MELYSQFCLCSSMFTEKKITSMPYVQSVWCVVDKIERCCKRRRGSKFWNDSVLQDASKIKLHWNLTKIDKITMQSCKSFSSWKKSRLFWSKCSQMLKSLLSKDKNLRGLSQLFEPSSSKNIFWHLKRTIGIIIWHHCRNN